MEYFNGVMLVVKSNRVNLSIFNMSYYAKVSVKEVLGQNVWAWTLEVVMFLVKCKEVVRG